MYYTIRMNEIIQLNSKSECIKYLREKDSVFDVIYSIVGDLDYKVLGDDTFKFLIETIIEQMLSSKVQHILVKRFCHLCGDSISLKKF